MKINKQLAKIVVKSFLQNLGDRRGIKHELEATEYNEPETWKEMVSSLEASVEKELNKHLP